MRLNRFHAFSDSVFSIIITLLVLDLRIPEYTTGHLGSSILRQLPMLFGFIISFFYVGVLWLYHHDFFQVVKKVDRFTNVINLFILFATALISYPTIILMMSLAHQNNTDMQAAIILYACVAMLISLSFLPLYPHFCKFHRLLIFEQIPKAFFMKNKYSPLFSVLIYMLAIVLSFIHSYLGIFFVILGIVFHFFAYLKMHNTLQTYEMQH